MVAVAPLSPNPNRQQRRAAASQAGRALVPQGQRAPVTAQRNVYAQALPQQRQAAPQQQQPQIWTPHQAQPNAQVQTGGNFYQQWQQQVPPELQRARQAQAANGGMVPRYAQPIQHFASRADEMSFDPSGQYNPQAFGGERLRAGIASAVPNPTERMFNRAGHLNAYDRKDALTQQLHLLKESSRVAHSALARRQAAQQMDAERRQVLAAAIHDPSGEGFAILGQELLLPIKDMVPYEAIMRKVFRVRPLAQGEYWRVAKDIRASAWVIGQDGQGVESRLYGRYVTPPEYKIGSFPTLDMDEIYQMNFDGLARAQETAREEISLEEDKRGIAVADTASTTVNTATSIGSLGVGAFEDVRFMVERHRLVVEKFLINRQELSDVIKTMSSSVDPVTERELILAGYIGAFLNAMIITSAGTSAAGQEVVPAGTFYAVTGPEYFGEMAVRVELFSEPFNMFSQARFVKGWAFGEIIGHVVVNPRAIAKGVK